MMLMGRSLEAALMRNGNFISEMKLVFRNKDHKVFVVVNALVGEKKNGIMQ